MLSFALILSRILFLQLAFCVSAPAQSWFVDPDLLSAAKIEELKEKYTNITEQNTPQILNDINYIQPMLELQVLKRNSSYYIVGKKARIITRIKVDGVNVVLGREITAKLNPMIKKVDSNDLRRNIVDVVYGYIRNKGYLQSSLRLEVVNPKDFEIEIKVSVFLGKPCLVHAINSSEKLDLEKINFPIQRGEICDVQDIKQRFESYSEKMRKNGFIDYSLKILDVRYYASTNSSEIILSGSPGLKTDIKVIDEKGNNLLFSLFAEDVIKEINIYEMNAEDIAAQIVDIYKNKGFYSIKVNGPFRQKDKKGNQIILFRVVEGEIYYIDDIQYYGLNAFSKKELTSLLNLKEFYQFRKKLRVDNLENGVSKLEAFYQNHGYWDIKIYQPQILIQKPGSAIVKIAIDEGKKYILNSLNISGDKNFKKGESSSVLEEKLGEVINQVDIVKLEDEIKKKYNDIGYLYANIDVQLKTSELADKVLVDIEVKANLGKRVIIGKVFISGLVDTKNRVVQRELLFKTGDWYDREKIEASRKFLINLSIFNSVAIQFADRFDLQAEADTLDIEVVLKEGLPGTVSFGPGWSQISGTRFSIDASYLNFAGQGRQFFSRAGFSEERSQEQIRDDSLVGRNLNLGYVEPWMFGLPIDGSLSFSHIATASDFWSLDYISEVSATHRFRSLSHDTSLSLFVRNKVSKEVGTREQNLLLVSSGDVRIASYGLRLSSDRRDDKGWPTKGYFVRGQISSADYILSSNVNYFNWEIDYRQYFKILDNVVFAFGVSYRAFDNTKRKEDLDNVLPSSERSYVGGADTVRGYDERSLGPYVIGSSDNFGGSYRGVYKAELRYQFWKPFVLTLFADAGNVFFSSQEVKILNQRLLDNGITDEVLGNYILRPEDYVENFELLWKNNFTSYGLALGLTTPLGVLNVSYGIPASAPEDPKCESQNLACPSFIDHDDNFLKRGRFHVNFGVNF